MSSSKPGLDGSQAIAWAAGYLKKGARSERELREHLERKGAGPKAIDEAVEYCVRKGGLDDRACARLCAGHWARHGYAWAAIREKLAAKGLPEDAIEHAAINILQSEGDDSARARELVRQRRAVAAPPPNYARLARLLASRGFDQDIIEQVLEIPADSGTQDDCAIE